VGLLFKSTTGTDKNVTSKTARHSFAVIFLSKWFTNEYGKVWSSRYLRHCFRFAEIFPDLQIVSALWRELSYPPVNQFCCPLLTNCP